MNSNLILRTYIVHNNYTHSLKYFLEMEEIPRCNHWHLQISLWLNNNTLHQRSIDVGSTNNSGYIPTEQALDWNCGLVNNQSTHVYQWCKHAYIHFHNLNFMMEDRKKNSVLCLRQSKKWQITTMRRLSFLLYFNQTCQNLSWLWLTMYGCCSSFFL